MERFAPVLPINGILGFCLRGNNCAAGDGVQGCVIPENDVDEVDVNDLPHSFKTFALTETAGDNDIAAAIFSKKPLGIRRHGEITVDVADSGGSLHSMYRYLIRNRISRNFVSGDYESVLSGIENMFKASKKEVVLDDDPDRPGVVYVTRLPFAILSSAGFTASQALQMIEQLVPVGVRVEADSFEGTFEFAATEMEINHDKGFSDHLAPEQQTMGGYLGFAIGEDDSTPLPI